MNRFQRKYHVYRKGALLLTLLILIDTLLPSIAYALTSGPTQPEVQSFEPFGTTEMVDLFTGDFTYNIPLFELPGPNGGYPFNLSYHSNIGLNQEASWVGLGWNLNPGAINRTMRGLPDDFNGDEIKKEMDLKKNWTVGAHASLELEPWTFDLNKAQSQAGIALSLGINTYYNSYRGVGYSLSPGVDFGLMGDDGMTSSLGLDLSLDNQDGATVTPSLHLESKWKNTEKYTSGKLDGDAAFSFNTNRGLEDISLGFTFKRNGILTAKKDKAGNVSYKGKGLMIRSSSTISFSNTSYQPTIGLPMTGFNVSFSARLGGDLAGIFGAVGIGGFYSEQKLKYKNLSTKSYGYLHLQEADREDLTDFNREKDGAIYKNSTNLPIPSLTYDVYNIQGHGVGGVFRPYRNDIGSIHDPYTESKMGGGAIGVEFGAGPINTHIAANGDINYSKTTSGPWENGNFHSTYAFQSREMGSLYEPVYFKRPGELTSYNTSNLWAKIGGNEPTKIKITGSKLNPSLSNIFQKNNQQIASILHPQAQQELDRVPRNMPIITLSNKETEVAGEFKNITYYSSISNYENSPILPLNRTERNGQNIEHHIGGISVLTTEGVRYNYGLPAYNHQHIEAAFSVDGEQASSYCGPTISIQSNGSKPDYHVSGTDEYFSRTETPPYTHAHLLTSIYGADYVDLENDGPTDDDLGYWVKFNYIKTTDNYKWKAPFSGANFMNNHFSDPEDDKASYLFGEKEMWHVARVETKTHVAIFHISPRKDGRGVSHEMQNNGDPLGAHSYKLDRISIYAKKEYELYGNSAPLLKAVNFEYSYDLCKNVDNNDGSNDTGTSGTIQNNGGKLTLKKVWFEHGSSYRGMLNPYIFDYNEQIPSENPPYHTHTFDRWDNYRPYHPTLGTCHNLDYPYTQQNDPQIDEYASAWHLKKITLPSGAEINVEYESDDYAYVQDKQAMQMFDILGTGVDPASIVEQITQSGQTAKVYNANGGVINGRYPNASERKLYIDLQQDIPINSTSTNQLDVYFEGVEQLYYKVFMRLRSPNEPYVSEYIHGYAEIESYGFDAHCEHSNGTAYNKAWIQIKPDEHGYHPFTMAGLQKLRYSLPKYSNTLGSVDDGSDASKIMQLFGMFGAIKDLFTNYYHNRTNDNNAYCSEIELGKSWIRLNTPDKIKYGGGVRVHKLSMNDRWNDVNPDQSSSEYGQIYEYRTIENGNSISSGVASYEPIIGGDENPLRYGKKVTDKQPMIRTEHNMLFEFPVNESYYPAPSVGYSKVTIKSLNTDEIIQAAEGNPSGEAYGFSSSGVSVHEFYTAKDFPVFSGETKLEKSKDADHMKTIDMVIPIPGMGTFATHKLAASQGYYLELNDMHGKLKKVSNYALDQAGHPEIEPYSWVEYTYFAENVVEDGQLKQKLVNEIPVLLSDRDPNNPEYAEIETRSVGMDVETFVDTRKYSSFSTNGGANFNVEFQLIPPLMLPIPVFMFWPNVGYSKKETRLAVTNKIIHRAGILKEVTAYNDGSIIKTENQLFDAQTGQPLLTTVENNFGEPVYQYSIPAHWKYDGMDAAYTNLNYSFQAPLSYAFILSGISPSDLYNHQANNIYKIDAIHPGVQHLTEGDEVLLEGSDHKKGYVFLTNENGAWIKVDGNGSSPIDNMLTDATFSDESYGNHYTLTVIRSGRRNLLSAHAGSVVALADPTKNREVYNCYHEFNETTGQIEVPNIYDIPEGMCLKSCWGRNFIREALENYTGSIPGFIDFSNISNEGCPFDNDIVGIHIGIDYIEIEKTTNSCRFNIVDSLGNSILSNDVFNAPSLYNPGVNDSIFGIEHEFFTIRSTNDIDTLNNGAFIIGDVLVNRRVVFDISLLPDIEGEAEWDYEYYLSCDFDHVDCFCTSGNIDSNALIFEDELYQLDSVLQVSVATYKDYWPQDFSDLRNDPITTPDYQQYVAQKAPQMNGVKGIWRGHESWAYVSDRKGMNSDNDEPNLSSDGIFDLTMFSWTGSPYANGCDANWIRANKVTQYSPYSYETENRDALGNYSAALYGYRGSVPIAVAANASESEIGFESFEEYSTTTPYDQYNTSTGNLSIYSSHTYNSITVFDEYETWGWVGQPFIESGGNTNIPLNIPGTEITVHHIIDCDGTSHSVSTTTQSILLSAESNYVWEGDTYHRYDSDIVPTNGGFVNNECMWSGTVRIPRQVTPTAFSYPIQITKEKAHTGNQCLAVDAMENIVYPQKHLKLINGKKYVFTAWIQRDNNQVPSYNESGTISIELSNGTNISYTPIHTVGKVIEGWQKIEGIFTYSPSTPNEKIHIRIDNGPGRLYLDDIRIHPVKATMETHVYDIHTYRLQSSLDNNNYATFYHYDEEGNLFLVDKETANGIQTLQESRSYMPPNE